MEVATAEAVLKSSMDQMRQRSRMCRKQERERLEIWLQKDRCNTNIAHRGVGDESERWEIIGENSWCYPINHAVSKVYDGLDKPVYTLLFACSYTQSSNEPEAFWTAWTRCYSAVCRSRVNSSCAIISKYLSRSSPTANHKWFIRRETNTDTLGNMQTDRLRRRIRLI